MENSINNADIVKELSSQTLFGRDPSLSTIRTLLERDTEAARSADENGDTILHYACLYQVDIEIIKLLVNHHPPSVETMSKDRGLPIHIACRVVCGEEAVSKRNRLVVVQYLAQLYPDGLRIKTKQGYLPIHLACSEKCPCLDLVRCLGEQDPATLDLADDTALGWYPLHYACLNGAVTSNLQVIQYLIQARPKSLLYTDEQQNTALHLATMRRHKGVATNQVVLYLANEGPKALQHRNCDERTPLHLAIDTGLEFPVIQSLVALRPKAVQALDRLHRTPLQVACQHGSSPLPVTKLLLETWPDGIHTVDNFQRFPLHTAVKASVPVETVRYLLDMFPDAVTSPDCFGEAPLHMARDYAVIESLLQVYPALMEWQDAEGKTPLQSALCHTSVEQCQTWDQVVQRDKFLQEWDRMTLFLWHAYYKLLRHPNPPHLISLARSRGEENNSTVNFLLENFSWLPRAAASAKSCPAEILSFLCRIFPPRLALISDDFQNTPLIAAIRMPFLQEDEFESNARKISILLDWNPVSPSRACQGRLPVAYVLEARRPPLTDSVIHRLLQLYPNALQLQDHLSGLYLFQLAARCSSNVETIYTILREDTNAFCMALQENGNGY